jgi:trimeric autotransporter adhesin
MRTHFIVLLLLLSAICKGQIITTIAGNGAGGSEIEGAPATNARLFSVSFCTWDKAGNLYFNERVKNRVRKITPNGFTVTVAGNTTFGYSGDGGQATNAQLYSPCGITIGKDGNLYICDLNNNRIRRVDLNTGIISTFVGNGAAGYSGDGGAATTAMLNGPTDICSDKQGNLFFTDRVNRVIRKISSGMITTYAGTYNELGYEGDGGPATLARLGITEGICSNNSGDIFVCNGTKIRKIDATTHIITSVAGTEAGGYNGDLIAATSANLYHPTDVAVDYENNVYIADTYNNRIRKVNTSGTINTVTGDGTTGFSGDGNAAFTGKLNLPEGVTFDTCWNLYIGDLGNNRIRKIALNPDCIPMAVAEVTETTPTIYPNPATETLTINAGVAIAHISISNAMGQQVLELHPTGGKKSVEANVQHLPPGMYIVRVNDVWVGKLVKE